MGSGSSLLCQADLSVVSVPAPLRARSGTHGCRTHFCWAAFLSLSARFSLQVHTQIHQSLYVYIDIDFSVIISVNISTFLDESASKRRSVRIVLVRHVTYLTFKLLLLLFICPCWLISWMFFCICISIVWGVQYSRRPSWFSKHVSRGWECRYIGQGGVTLSIFDGSRCNYMATLCQPWSAENKERPYGSLHPGAARQGQRNRRGAACLLLCAFPLRYHLNIQDLIFVFCLLVFHPAKNNNPKTFRWKDKVGLKVWNCVIKKTWLSIWCFALWRL